MTWDGIVTSYHKKHIQELNIKPTLAAYIQLIVLKKTLEGISLERRRSTDLEEVREEEVERALEKLEGPIVEHREETGGEKRQSLGESKGRTAISKHQPP